MTKEERIDHNKRVIKDIISTLVETGKADPVRMLKDSDYLVEMVSFYLQAANLARSSMNMPPLVIYTLDDEEIPVPES